MKNFHVQFYLSGPNEPDETFTPAGVIRWRISDRLYDGSLFKIVATVKATDVGEAQAIVLKAWNVQTWALVSEIDSEQVSP